MKNFQAALPSSVSPHDPATGSLDIRSGSTGGHLRLRSMAIALVAIGVLVGCNPRDPGASETDDSPVAAVIDGREITLAEVHRHLQEQFLEEFLRQPDERVFEMRQNAIHDLVQRHVVETEAERLGKTPEEVMASITDSIAEPTDEDIEAWYRQNQARLRGAKLEDVKPAIRDVIEREREAAARQAFFEPKLEALSWTMVLTPPRKELETTRLVRGPDDAPVTITAFSDYQCPYCVQAEPVLAELRARYPDEVKIVHRHFPLDSIHPFAREAAEAAMCADEQGKFWAFHDGIFARRGQLDEGSMTEISEAVGLDGEAFQACVAERRYKDFVEKDFAAGRAAGVTGTPSFFLNGIALTGARNADELSRQVDMELARLKAE